MQYEVKSERLPEVDEDAKAPVHASNFTASALGARAARWREPWLSFVSMFVRQLRITSISSNLLQGGDYALTARACYLVSTLLAQYRKFTTVRQVVLLSTPDRRYSTSALTFSSRHTPRPDISILHIAHVTTGGKVPAYISIPHSSYSRAEPASGLV